MVKLQVLWRLCRVGEHLMLGALLTLALGLVRHPPARIVRWWHSRLCRILRVSVLLEDEASETGGLLVCNHVSWLDIPVLGSLRSLRFIAKSEVRRWPLAGWLAARVGTLFIRRGAGDLKRIGQEMAGLLNRGCDLALFPEGTTTDGRDLRPFFPRLLAPALEASRPIIPVAIRYTQTGVLSPAAPFVGEDALLPHLVRLLRGPPIEAWVRFCPPLPTAGRDRRSLALEARRSIRQGLASMPGGLSATGRYERKAGPDSVAPQPQPRSWT